MNALKIFPASPSPHAQTKIATSAGRTSLMLVRAVIFLVKVDCLRIARRGSHALRLQHVTKMVTMVTMLTMLGIPLFAAHHSMMLRRIVPSRACPRLTALAERHVSHSPPVLSTI